MTRRILFIVASHGFRDEELLLPRRTLDSMGFDTRVASPPGPKVHGMRGSHLPADLHLDGAAAEPFDAIVVVGGTGAIEELWGNAWLLHLLQRAAMERKLVVGVGLGVIPLAQAELLQGEHATCYPSDRAIAELERHGGRRVPGDLVDEGTGVITARGPEAAGALGRRIAVRLGESVGFPAGSPP